MDASGQLTYKNHAYEVSGTGWMDREFGTWEPCEQYRGWDWIAIQLEDGREMMVYMIRDSEHRPTGFSSLTLIESDGSQRVFPASEFSVQESEQWVSPYSGTTYPSRWRIRIPAVAAELEIQPVLACQELDTRGSSQVIYWEGAATAHGRIDGSAARGRAFVELVGYNRDHHNLSLLNFFANELRFRGRSREHTYRIQNCD